MTLTHDYPDRVVDLVLWRASLPAASRRASMVSSSSGWHCESLGDGAPAAGRSSVHRRPAVVIIGRDLSDGRIPWPRNSSSPKSSSTSTQLYREEIFTDRKAGRCVAWCPVLADGSTMPRARCCTPGQTQLLTPAGVLPLAFELEASSLEDACNKFPDAVKVAIEQAIEEAREMRREAASRIVVPEGGMGGPPAAAAGASSFNGDTPHFLANGVAPGWRGGERAAPMQVTSSLFAGPFDN